MDLSLLFDNLTNPAFLFFILGIIAVKLKSDLGIPPNSSKFISLYLLFSIGFKGGQELAHSHFTMEMIWSILFGIAIACVIPFYAFFILKRKLSIENSGAIAAVMALMEAPAIVIGVILVQIFIEKREQSVKIPKVIMHSFTNGSVLLILGSQIVGLLQFSQPLYL